MQTIAYAENKTDLQYQAAFTWSHLLRPVPGFTIGTNEFGPTGDQNDLTTHSSGYGPDHNIRPQRFVLSAVLASPQPLEASFLPDRTLAWLDCLQPPPCSRTAIRGASATTTSTTSTASPPIGQALPQVAPRRIVPTAGSMSQRVNNYINTACFTTPAVIGDDGVATGFWQHLQRHRAGP